MTLHLFMICSVAMIFTIQNNAKVRNVASVAPRRVSVLPLAAPVASRLEDPERDLLCAHSDLAHNNGISIQT